MVADADSVETVAHVIQIALTPVFLFSGVATLLSVLATRLGRVADRVDLVSDRIEGASAREQARLKRRLAQLRRRTQILDLAVCLAALGGMSTLLAAGVLFIDVVRDRAGATLFVAFACALVLTIGALAGFLIEMMLASIGIRIEATATVREADAPEPGEGPEALAAHAPADPDSGASQG